MSRCKEGGTSGRPRLPYPDQGLCKFNHHHHQPADSDVHTLLRDVVLRAVSPPPNAAPGKKTRLLCYHCHNAIYEIFPLIISSSLTYTVIGYCIGRALREERPGLASFVSSFGGHILWMSAVIHISSKKENGLEERNDFWYILQKKEKAGEREGGRWGETYSLQEPLWYK